MGQVIQCVYRIVRSEPSEKVSVLRNMQAERPVQAAQKQSDQDLHCPLAESLDCLRKRSEKILRLYRMT